MDLKELQRTTALQGLAITSQVQFKTAHGCMEQELITARTDMVPRWPHLQGVGIARATTVRVIMQNLDTIQIGAGLELELTTASVEIHLPSSQLKFNGEDCCLYDCTE